MQNIVQIHFTGPINIPSAEAFRNMMLNAIRQNADSIEILLSSEGGDLNSGFTMYNYIRSCPVPTSVVNMGSVESIAMLPFLGAEKRSAVSNARFLIHNFTWTFHNAPIDINRIAEHSESLSADVERYVGIFHERTSGAECPIDPRVHLTGPAIVIRNPEAARAGIINTDFPASPTLSTASFYERLYK